MSHGTRDLDKSDKELNHKVADRPGLHGAGRQPREHQALPTRPDQRAVRAPHRVAAAET